MIINQKWLKSSEAAEEFRRNFKFPAAAKHRIGESPSAFAAASSACYGRRALLTRALLGCFYMKDAAAVSVSQAKAMQHLTLSNGVKIPVVGSGCAFGNWTGRAPLATFTPCLTTAFSVE